VAEIDEEWALTEESDIDSEWAATEDASDADAEWAATEDDASLANLGRSGEAGADWSGVTPENLYKTAVPLAVGAGTAYLTGGLSVPLQIGANVLAGAGSRALVGEDPLDKTGMALDVAIPGVAAVGRGLVRGLRAPLMAEKYADLGDATRITDWRMLPDVEATGVAARPVREEAAGVGRELISGPVSVGSRADNPAIRDMARRLDIHPRARARLESHINRIDEEAFVETKALGRKSVMPQAEREDVGLVMHGRKSEGEVSERVRSAVGKLRQFYDDMGEVGERFGMFTDDAPRRANYSGPLVPSERGEAVRTLKETLAPEQGTRRPMKAFERKNEFDPTYHVSDARDLLHAWKDKYLDPYAAAYPFGPKGTGEVGRVADELLNRAASGELSGKDTFALQLLKDSLKDIYQRPAQTKLDTFIGPKAQAVATAFLPRTWLRQGGQAAWNLGRYGLENTVEGLTRYRRDPGMRDLLSGSGARTGSMVRHFGEMAPDTEPNWVGRSIGWAEDKLRGPLSAGAVPYTEQLFARANAGHQSRGLARQIREMGLEMSEVPATPTASSVRDAYSGIVGRTQLLSSSPGQSSSALIGRPAARGLSQFKPFSLGAARLFRDDVVDPIASGVRNRDMSELGLGVGRLGRLIPSALGAEAVVATLMAAQGLQAPDYTEVPERALETNLGLPASLAFAAARRGPLRAGSELVPPVASIMEGDSPSSLALAILATKYPQVAGKMAMFAPAFRSVTGVR
jgi:hypothetical protein